MYECTWSCGRLHLITKVCQMAIHRLECDVHLIDESEVFAWQTHTISAAKLRKMMKMEVHLGKQKHPPTFWVLTLMLQYIILVLYLIKNWWFGYLVMMRPRIPPGRFFRLLQMKRDPRRAEQTLFLSWSENTLESSQKSLKRWLWIERSGPPCSNCCPHDLTVKPINNGWMDFSTTLKPIMVATE